ncbi:MAG: hypothetical protein IJU45_01670 [Clostridia bacterium]|nr:hypothetical protein [Clostridia bacterium]
MFQLAAHESFVRAYPQAVEGEIEEYSFDTETSEFKMSFRQDSEGESIIASPFPIKTLTVDGKEYPYKLKYACAAVTTAPGEHEITIRFEKKV